jgi:hypothetical protein
VDLTHYEVLGVAPDADRATIRAAYRRRARETHPDAGGDDAAFAAVALAWWTLSSAERRARYDAGEDADQEEDDWGEDLGWDDAPAAPTPPQPAPRPGQPAPAPGAPRTPVADLPGRPPADPDAPPRPVDPLTSVPRSLPRRARPTGLSDPYARHYRVPVLAGASAILLLVATLIAFPSLTEGPITSDQWVGVMLYAALLWFALWYRARTHEAGSAARALGWTAAWGALGVHLLLNVGGLLVDGSTTPQVVLVTVTGLLGLGLVLDSGRRVRGARRRAALDRRARRRLTLAHRWDRLLTLRDRHGAAHVVAGERDGRPVWLLVGDGSGNVLDWAPAAAPRAWAHVLREVGVDVAPVPDPRG